VIKIKTALPRKLVLLPRPYRPSFVEAARITQVYLARPESPASSVTFRISHEPIEAQNTLTPQPVNYLIYRPGTLLRPSISSLPATPSPQVFNPYVYTKIFANS
jgi:hypothetical protein